MVLIVDDDRAFCYSLKDILEMAGFGVFTAHNGNEVMDLVTDEKPDIVIMDVVLPDKNGIQVMADLRKKIANLPVILVTGQGEIDEIAKQTKNEIDTFLFTKPLPVEKFLERLVEVSKNSKN